MKPILADLHRSLPAYISDYQLVGTTILPHGIRWEQDNVQMASLDHAMWFHRPGRADPHPAAARGMNSAGRAPRFFDQVRGDPMCGSTVVGLNKTEVGFSETMLRTGT